MNRVFISHPYRNAPLENAEHVVNIARRLARSDQLPIAPQIYLPQFVYEATERDLALRMCLALVGLSDEVRVFREATVGMLLEIEEAHRLGIPVVDGVTGKVIRNKRTAPDGVSRAVVKR